MINLSPRVYYTFLYHISISNDLILLVLMVTNNWQQLCIPNDEEKLLYSSRFKC